MLSRVFHTLFDFGVLSWHKASKCSMGILGCFNPRTVLFNTCGLEIAHLIMCLDNYWRERNEGHAVTHSCKLFCYANCDWHCLKLMGFYENRVLPKWFIRFCWFHYIWMIAEFWTNPNSFADTTLSITICLFTCRAPDAGLVKHGLSFSIGLQGFGWPVWCHISTGGS